MRSCVPLCSPTTSISSKFNSITQERMYRGRIKVPGCVLDIKGCIECRIKLLEIPEDTADGCLLKNVALNFPLQACKYVTAHESDHLSFCLVFY